MTEFVCSAGQGVLATALLRLLAVGGRPALAAWVAAVQVLTANRDRSNGDAVVIHSAHFPGHRSDARLGNRERLAAREVV